MKKQLFLLMLLSAGWSTIHSAAPRRFRAGAVIAQLEQKLANLKRAYLDMTDAETAQFGNALLTQIAELQAEINEIQPDRRQNYRNRNGG